MVDGGDPIAFLILVLLLIEETFKFRIEPTSLGLAILPRTYERGDVLRL